MKDEHRGVLAAVLHPVRQAAQGVSDQIWIVNDPAATPTPGEALRALDMLQAEVARARTLVAQLAAQD
ncbi:hypothetical protein [Nonomuraea fuscirosea]|uniref:hypothetical protein n=1 Tax=Nonomuraea fuscirosea TaxID=1291556 RepID=UPI00342288A3